jgi:uncharacterized membrane protein
MKIPDFECRTGVTRLKHTLTPCFIGRIHRSGEPLPLVISVTRIERPSFAGHNARMAKRWPVAVNKEICLTTSRLEAFSDGVIAIIITIMVLELKVPHEGGHLADLKPLLPVFVSYILSFAFVGIYWNNHHHMLQATERVTGGMLWANLHLLFWLSLVPFVTAWVGQNRFAPTPMASYGVVLLMAGFAYWILQQAIIRTQGPDSLLAKAVGKDRKGKAALLFYAASIPLAFVHPLLAGAIFVLVALMWLIPDRRIEKMIENHD